MKGHIDSLREYTNQAQAHLETAGAAHARGDSRGLEASHRALGGVLRGMHRTFESLGKAGEKAGADKNKTIQTSSGVGISGGSENGRGSPLYTQGNAGIAGWLARARIGGGRK
jgi:hypothetical protein